MRPEDTARAVQQIDAVLTARDASLVPGYDPTDPEYVPDKEVPALLAMSHAAIERLAPIGSSYRRDLDRSSVTWGTNRYEALEGAIGILIALKSDYEAGHLETMPSLIHGELFGDFLEMASHLLDTGYKDAAAVIAGSTLEGHLRQLAQQAELAAENESGRAFTGERLNADLAKAGAFDKTDQKSVTAWLGIRNDAAHGKYDGYDAPRVALMIDGVRDFLRRTPA